MTEENKVTSPEPSGKKTDWGGIAVAITAFIGIVIVFTGMGELSSMETFVSGITRMYFGGFILLIALFGLVVWAVVKAAKARSTKNSSKPELNQE